MSHHLSALSAWRIITSCINHVHVCKPCMETLSPQTFSQYMFFPTYKTQNKGFLGILHDWDPRWGPPETPSEVKKQ